MAGPHPPDVAVAAEDQAPGAMVQADRPLHRRRGTPSLSAALAGTASVVVVVGLLVLLFTTAPGASKVASSFFSVGKLGASAGTVASGFLLNVELTVVSEALVLVLALVIAVVRSLPGPAFLALRGLAVLYTDVMRGIPIVLVVFMVGFGLPGLQLGFISNQSLFSYGVVSLVLVYSAYVAENYRAGIESVHPSQVSAARSLGLSRWQAMRHVVLPQAIRTVIPPLMNDLIGLEKDTALVGLIGLVEASRAAQDYASTTFNFAGYTMAAILFIAITIPLARFTDYVVARGRRRRGV
ncbi:MAG: amino acid ABC transporter permease [Actinomycetota bacterium]|nr:amino acid ABC transporter permease [Actinomycetota bacterium]